MMYSGIKPREPHFYLWEAGPTGHVLLQSPYISVMARVRVDSPHTDGPPGYASRANNVTGLVQALADWQQFNNHFSGSGVYGDKNYIGSLFIQNYGSSPSLGSNAGDACGTGLYKNDSIYMASGIAAVAPIYSGIAGALKTELDNRGLAYPAYLNTDFEGWGGNISSNMWAPTHTDGWFAASLSDPRYSQATLYKKYVPYSGMVSQTFSGFMTDYYANGGPPANYSIYYFQGTNITLMNAYYNAYVKANDYAIWESYGKFFRHFFPNSRHGNYQLVKPLHSGTFFYTDNNRWFAPYSKDSDPLLADVQVPALYGSQFGVNGWNTTNLGSTSGDVYVNYNCRNLAACLSGTNAAPTIRNSMDVIPWIGIPGDPIGYDYTPTEDNIYTCMESGLLTGGIKHWSIFNAYSDAADQTSTLSLINRFVNLYNSQSKLFRGRIIGGGTAAGGSLGTTNPIYED